MKQFCFIFKIALYTEQQTNITYKKRCFFPFKRPTIEIRLEKFNETLNQLNHQNGYTLKPKEKSISLNGGVSQASRDMSTIQRYPEIKPRTFGFIDSKPGQKQAELKRNTERYLWRENFRFYQYSDWGITKACFEQTCFAQSAFRGKSPSAKIPPEGFECRKLPTRSGCYHCLSIRCGQCKPSLF